MRPSEGPSRRPRGPNTTGYARSYRVARGPVGTVAATLATATGLVAAVAEIPALAASLAALAFAACWLAVVCSAHALARVFGRR